METIKKGEQMETIKQVLILRDHMTAKEANKLIKLARNDFENRIMSGDDVTDICEEWFGLEPDYIYDLI